MEFINYSSSNLAHDATRHMKTSSESCIHFLLDGFQVWGFALDSPLYSRIIKISSLTFFYLQ